MCMSLAGGVKDGTGPYPPCPERGRLGREGREARRAPIRRGRLRGLVPRLALPLDSDPSLQLAERECGLASPRAHVPRELRVCLDHDRIPGC
jgi:hypothetical protein